MAAPLVEHGLAGLRDRSRKPLRSPNTTNDEVIGKVIYLRQHYHFGPLKISMYLQRYHNITISAVEPVANLNGST